MTGRLTIAALLALPTIWLAAMLANVGPRGTVFYTMAYLVRVLP